MASHRQAYANNHQHFEIADIEWEDDSEIGEVGRGLLDEIAFEYGAPDIAVDSSGRFQKHEIIGGATVRQKIGEDPIEVSITGVCKESTARQLDALRDAKFGTIFSNRLVNGSLQVQFASVSTRPMQSGGAAALNDDEFLYTFDLSCIEVVA